MAKPGKGNRDGSVGTEDELAPEFDSPSSRPSDGRPGPVHEGFWEAIRDEVYAIVHEYAPTMGTVVGKDAGMVRVVVDDEDDEREVGLPRKRGEQYDEGDRVKLTKLRGGEMVVDGSFSTAQGTGGNDAAVGDEDVHTDAISERHLRQNSVTNDAISPGSVTNDSIRGTNLDARVSDAYNRGSEGVAAAGAVNTAVFGQGGLKSEVNKIDADLHQGQNSIDNKIADNKAAINTIQRDIGGQGLGGKINNLESKINSLESDIADLEKKIKKLESNSNNK
jgi:hypothetical protein